MSENIPFRLAGGAQPLIVVPARVNGVGPFPFVLDTGAGPCLVSPDLARWAGVGGAAREAAVGGGGPVEVGLGAAGLAVGDAAAEEVPVAVTALLERIGEAVKTPLFGAIGYGFLRRFELT